jgi:hypothetical protein
LVVQEKQGEEGLMKLFCIKKGKHSSGFHFGLTFTKKIAFKAMFDKSCLYNLKSIDNYDINKLFGFSTTHYHHRQSARVGWRCLDGENIQIVTYSYKDGLFHREQVLGTVKPGEEFLCSIEDVEDYYIYRFTKGNEDVVVKDEKMPDWFLFHYLLWPYFGGNNPAPHDMKLYLKRV